MKPQLRVWALAAIFILLLPMVAACGGAEPAMEEAAAEAAEPETAAESTEAESSSAYNEAPMLAEMVANGELPPVDERLPAEPQVVEPEDRIGTYGGTLRFGEVNPINLWSFATLRMNGLFRYDFSNTQVFMDIAKDYYFSDDFTTLTIELREGHKWSDGEPFTTDDIMFAWEDVAMNEDLSPAGPRSIWRAGGEPAVFTKISDTVVEISFAVPYPIIMNYLGRTGVATDNNVIMPKHWLKQWHIDYNPDAQKLAEEEGFETWMQAFNFHNRPPNNFRIDGPTLWAWKNETLTSDRAVVVRNPYFHQVDTAGNQLPYIDRIEAVITGDKEVQTLKASAGEFDFETYYIDMKDMSVFQQGAEQGNYRVEFAQNLFSAELGLMPNRTVKDPVLRELFNNKDFRIALSISIDRESMNDTLFFGLGRPFPATVNPGLSFFKEEWATTHAEYDPERANALLDSIGLTERDSAGYRLRPDGEGRLSMLIHVGVSEGPKIAMAELVRDDWAEVGLEAIVENLGEQGGLFSQRLATNDLQIPTWHLDRNALFGRSLGSNYAVDQTSFWTGTWKDWFRTNGEEGVEPPEEIKRQREIFEQYKLTAVGTEDFDRLGAEYYEYFTSEIPMIGTIGFTPRPVIISNRLHNVPLEGAAWISDNNFYAPFMPSQWFIEE